MTFPKSSFPTAKDINGDPTLICLDSQGRVPVTAEPPGICYFVRGKVDLTETGGTPDVLTIGDVDLVASKTYESLEFHGSANVDTLYTICYVNDGGETVLHEFLSGPGNPNSCCNLHCFSFATDAGTIQKLRIKAEAISADCLGCAIGYVASEEQP